MKVAAWLTSAQRTASMLRFHSDVRGRAVVEHEARETHRIREWLKRPPAVGLLEIGRQTHCNAFVTVRTRELRALLGDTFDLP